MLDMLAAPEDLLLYKVIGSVGGTFFAAGFCWFFGSLPAVVVLGVFVCFCSCLLLCSALGWKWVPPGTPSGFGLFLGLVFGPAVSGWALPGPRLGGMPDGTAAPLGAPGGSLGGGLLPPSEWPGTTGQSRAGTRPGSTQMPAREE